MRYQMQEIKLNLEVTVSLQKDIKPVAGMIVEFKDLDKIERRLLVKNEDDYLAIDLKNMEVSDDTINGGLVCLRAEKNAKVLGKLTL